MRKNVSLARGAGWLIGGAVVAISGQAAAQACPTTPNTVFMSGSSAFKPVLQATAKALGTAVNIVYQAPGSCEGPQHLLGDSGGMPTPDTDAAIVFPASGAAGVTCTLPGVPAAATVDIGISDVYLSTCVDSYDPGLNTGKIGTTAKDFLGPVQAMTFAAPTASTANNISAEAAYMVFGFDAVDPAHTIAPWSNPLDIYVRFWDSGTQEMIASAIGLPGGKWKNATTTTTPLPAQQTTGSGNMIQKITAAAAMDPNGTIGVLGAANIYGAAGIKPLAFQATGQSCAFYPDSSSSAADKLNVRQGRYDIWGAEHMVAYVDGSGNPVGQNGNTSRRAGGHHRPHLHRPRSAAGQHRRRRGPAHRGPDWEHHRRHLDPGSNRRRHSLVRDGGLTERRGRTAVLVSVALPVHLPIRDGRRRDGALACLHGVHG